MTEPTITQDQIDALLKEVAIEDRIQNQYERIELKIDQLLSQTQSKDLTAAKAALGRQMAFVTRNNSESQDTAPKLRDEMKKLAIDLLGLTKKLPVGRRYGLIFSSLPDQEHQIDVLRVRKMPQDQLLIYQAACTYANLLPWATIRKIIESVVQ